MRFMSSIERRAAVRADRFAGEIHRCAAVRAVDGLHVLAQVGQLRQRERPDEFPLPKEVEVGHCPAASWAVHGVSGSLGSEQGLTPQLLRTRIAVFWGSERGLT